MQKKVEAPAQSRPATCLPAKRKRTRFRSNSFSFFTRAAHSGCPASPLKAFRVLLRKERKRVYAIRPYARIFLNIKSTLPCRKCSTRCKKRSPPCKKCFPPCRRGAICAVAVPLRCGLLLPYIQQAALRCCCGASGRFKAFERHGCGVCLFFSGIGVFLFCGFRWICGFVQRKCGTIPHFPHFVSQYPVWHGVSPRNHNYLNINYKCETVLSFAGFCTVFDSK